MRQIALLCCVSACSFGGAKRSEVSGLRAPPPTAVADGMPVAAGPAIAGEPGTTPGDTHVNYGVNPWVETGVDHLSTFAADVDTASYTFARRTLFQGALPPTAAVRVEEFVNYFKYAFPPAAAGSPFSVVMDAAPSPLAPGHHILRVGVATPRKANAQRKPASLVFLVDVSGSMSSADKLPLAKQALKVLTANLNETDNVSLVTYAGSTRVVLPLTSAEHKQQILSAIDDLSSGGSTAMAGGLDLAYSEAMKGLRPGAVSRVIVMSDGDANVGTANHQDMLAMIDGRVKAGVTLSTIGFGMGNYRADLMEQLGDHGNGNNYYIDSLDAATKLFTTELVSVLEVAAKDVKLQVDFDATMVARYRLVGYENRAIRDEDFRKDRVDAGEVGVGHQVTALYEVQLTDRAKAAPGPLGVVRIRHKQPEGETATEAAFRMVGAPAASFAQAPDDLRFAFAVASFADVLRGAEDAAGWSLAEIAAAARATAHGEPDRIELVGLIERAQTLRGPTATVAR